MRNQRVPLLNRYGILVASFSLLNFALVLLFNSHSLGSSASIGVMFAVVIIAVAAFLLFIYVSNVRRNLDG